MNSSLEICAIVTHEVLKDTNLWIALLKPSVFAIACYFLKIMKIIPKLIHHVPSERKFVLFHMLPLYVTGTKLT